jgi:SNF2 family DNA or RNA helicase
VSASNDLEDWHESEDSSTAHSTDSLADSLDKLSIANDHTDVTALANGPKFISSQKQKSKILDSFAVLDEVSKFGRRTPKASHEVTDLDDDDDDDADTGKYSDKDDDFEAVSHSKHSTMKNCRGINLTAEEQSPEVSLDTDTNEKKNGGEDASVTFVHANMVFRLPPKVAKILFPHQLEGIKWLWGLHVKGTGGILGDDMGLGKTMQVYLDS